MNSSGGRAAWDEEEEGEGGGGDFRFRLAPPFPRCFPCDYLVPCEIETNEFLLAAERRWSPSGPPSTFVPVGWIMPVITVGFYWGSSRGHALSLMADCLSPFRCRSISIQQLLRSRRVRFFTPHLIRLESYTITHTHTHTHTAARAADSSIMDNNWSIRDCARCVFNETATLPPSRRLPFSAFHFHKTRFSWLVVVVVVIVVVVGNGQVFSWRIIRSACYGRRNEAARLLGLHRRVPLPFRSSFVFAPARRWNRSKRLGLIKGASRRRRRRRRRRLLPHETAPRAMAWSRARIKGDDSYGPQKKNKQKGTFQTVLGHRKPSFP